MARLPNFLVIIRSEKLSGKGQGRGVGVRKKERFVLGKRTFRSQKSKHFVLRIIYDMSEIMMLIYINPEAANSLLKKCSDFILRYCMALKATGVNGVVMAEPAAGLLSDEDCTQYSSVFIKEIVEKVQDDHFTVILHNCGNTGHCTKAMVATGAAAYHFGNKIDMVEALKEVPADALAMGNLDPVSLFKAATPEVMKKATLDLLEATKSYPNFVLSSGCDTPPHTPSENIDAFFAALNEFNNA